VTPKTDFIKVGRQGVLARGMRVPASFFRHRQPGKRFVVLAAGDRRLMHVRASDLEAIRRAYRSYVAARKDCRRTKAPARRLSTRRPAA
jgi:hypothetical protein